MATPGDSQQSRFGATLRDGERVTPLELFFDLVFVLAITQCTALMSHHPTWSGLAQGLLVLGVLLGALVVSVEERHALPVVVGAEREVLEGDHVPAADPGPARFFSPLNDMADSTTNIL